jgi:CRP/FNR family transcriptional regulator/CRP/FNR family cyclic AMP-dependent transcriptional regulator
MPRDTGDLDRIAATMLTTPLLEGVPAKAIRGLAAGGRPRTYRKGTYLCHQGDPAEEIYFLCRGRLEIASVSFSGNRILHATIDTPQFVGELGLLAESDRTASVLTLEECEVWVADSDDFLAFLAEEPAAARGLLRALARQVEANEAFVDDLLFLDLKGRVAKRLLQLATPTLDELPRDGVTIPAVTHADLASLCGGSRENVTRILSDLQRRGVVLRDGQRYQLKKVASLAKIAGL